MSGDQNVVTDSLRHITSMNGNLFRQATHRHHRNIHTLALQILTLTIVRHVIHELVSDNTKRKVEAQSRRYIGILEEASADPVR